MNTRRRERPEFAGDRRRNLWTGAGLLCAGLFYGYVLIPLGVCVPCPFHAVTGLRCPGCGITGLCLDLLHGRFSPSYNWGLVLASPAVFWLAWPGRRHGRAEAVTAWAVLAFLLVWGVLRNLWGI